MWNLFEQPWTLVGFAVIVLLGVGTYRAAWPQRQHFWQWLLPIGVAALGFGLDFAVATNPEKINHALSTSIKAARDEDCAALGRLIAPDYQDSVHKSKAALLELCQARLVPPAIDRIKVIGKAIKITPPLTTATLTLQVRFDPQSYWVRTYQQSAVLIKVEIWLRQQADRSWLVTRIEPSEVDMMSVNWGMAKDCPCPRHRPVPAPVPGPTLAGSIIAAPACTGSCPRPRPGRTLCT